MALHIPDPIRTEHNELHAALVDATRAGGRTGEAAEAVAHLLHSHFAKEEQLAMPLLSLLRALAAGEDVPDAAEAASLADQLRTELPRMLQEHTAVIAAFNELADTAHVEGKPEHAEIARKLVLHARTEEEVLYPAALLVGRLLAADALLLASRPQAGQAFLERRM